VGWQLRLLLAAELQGLAWGWSEDGHGRIARIAEALLKGKHKDKVRTMLHKDLVDTAGWERDTLAKQPNTAVLHWHRQTPEWTCDHGIGLNGKLRCNSKEAADDSMLCALGSLFRKYAHDALLREFPKAKEPLWESDTKYAEILQGYVKDRHLEAVVATNATELRWMVALLGDLHQPLHLLAAHGYGHDVKVMYQGQEHTLLSFWEDYIPKHLPPVPSQTELDKLYADMTPNWIGTVPTELFRDWARESAELACRGIYAGMTVNHPDGSHTFDPQISEQTFQGWVKMAEDMTLRSGVRLAFVLLDVIEHRKHRLASREGRGRRHRHTRYRQNLGTNLAIAVVVVPLLLLLLRLHERVGSKSLTGLVLKHLKL